MDDSRTNEPLETGPEPGELLEELLEQGAPERAQDVLKDLTPSAVLRAVLSLDPEERDEVLSAIPAELAAEVIDGAPHEVAADMVERLEAATAADIIEELDSDVQADVIGDLDDEDADAILAEMEADEAAEIRRLAEFDDETAGGLMLAEAFQFASSETVAAVLARLASEDEQFERYRGQHPYIVDVEGRLVGVVSLRALLTARRSAPLAEIMTAPVSVPADTGLDELEDLFERHPFLGLPVVDDDGRLIGVVSRSAVAEAALERAESDSLKRQGVVGDELRSMPLTLRSRRRLAWLSINILLNVLAASVIAAYEQTLAAVIAIAVFLPMVSDMSGCSGNQAVAVTLRELALGLTRPADALRVWLKEIAVGVINGIVLGVLIGIVCWLWKGNAWLGVVIGLALALNTLIAVSIGGTVPLLLTRFRQDPAVASGPLLTTITDMAGFFLVLSLAAAFMPLLL